MSEYQKPFTKSFVLNTTLRNIQAAIDKSSRISIARLPEFENDSETKREILETLSSLSELSHMVQSIRENNKHLLEK